MLKPAAKPKSKPKKAEEVERPDVELHDDIYFRHAAGPKVGRVVAHGKHGATVHADGEHHKVRWENVLGHKVKVRPDVRVVDQGVDGMIVQDPAGRRRYVHDPVGEEPAPLAKSLVPRVVFFGRGAELAKALGGEGSIKNRPGLVKKKITDRNGKQADHYVRASKPQPKERHAAAPEEAPARPRPAHAAHLKEGTKVAFQVGGAKGSGIIGSGGADGAIVRDETGHEHEVPWDKIKSASPGDGGGKGGADGGDGGETDDPDHIARTLFNTSEMEKLPKKASQPVDSWEELLPMAEKGLEEYTEILSKVAKSLGLVTGKRPATFSFAQKEENEKAKEEGRAPKKLDVEEYMLPEHWDDPRGYLFMGPLKKHDRALVKVTKDYKGHWDRLLDMVRATIAVPSMTQVPKVLRMLEAHGLTPVQQPKNNFIKPLPGGYRDVNLIVRLPNGMVAEMQVHVKPMTLAKEKGHHDYKTVRDIEDAHKDEDGNEADPSEWSEEHRRAHGKAMARMEKLYGVAWDKAKKKAPE